MRDIERLKSFIRGLQEREPGHLAASIGVIGVVGTVGSIVGRKWYLVPSASFGNTGEWVSGSAAVAALLGVAKQLETSRELQRVVLGEAREVEWHRSTRALCLQLDVLSSVIDEDEAHGIVFKLGEVEIRAMIQRCGSELRELERIGARLDNDPFSACKAMALAWSIAAGHDPRGRVLRGFSESNNALIASLRPASTKV